MFAPKALLPIATLFEPVVLASKARVPKALLCAPVVLAPSALMPMMVKAVQELSAKVEELESKLNGE